MAILLPFDNPNSGRQPYREGFIRVLSIMLGNTVPGQYHARIEFGRWASKEDFMSRLPPVNTFGYNLLGTRQPPEWLKNSDELYIDADGNVIPDQEDESKRIVIRPAIKSLGELFEIYAEIYSSVKRSIYIEFHDHPELIGGQEDT